MNRFSMESFPSGSNTASVEPSGAIASLARWVLRHRRLVVALWLVAFLAGGFGASHVSKRLSLDFSLPGQPGYETGQKITRLYGNGAGNPSAVLVLTAPAGETILGERPQLARAFASARAASHRARIVDFTTTGERSMITRDGRSTYALLFTPLEKSFGAPKVPVEVQRALARAVPAGTTVSLTGLSQLSTGGSSKGPGVFVETLIGGGGALAVLAFVFASLLAFVPLLIAPSRSSPRCWSCSR